MILVTTVLLPPVWRLNAETSTQNALPIYCGLPRFSLSDSKGNLVTNKDIAGKICIFSFVWTKCLGECTAQSRLLSKYQDSILTDSRVRLFSITVDSQKVDSSALDSYRTSFAPKHNSWIFLSGISPEPQKLQYCCMTPYLLLEKNSADDLMANPRLTLVDDRLNIRGYYNLADRNSLLGLLRDVNLLIGGCQK